MILESTGTASSFGDNNLKSSFYRTDACRRISIRWPTATGNDQRRVLQSAHMLPPGSSRTEQTIGKLPDKAVNEWALRPGLVPAEATIDLLPWAAFDKSCVAEFEFWQTSGSLIIGFHIRFAS
jgi:hypothetical protein